MRLRRIRQIRRELAEIREMMPGLEEARDIYSRILWGHPRTPQKSAAAARGLVLIQDWIEELRRDQARLRKALARA